MKPVCITSAAIDMRRTLRGPDLGPVVVFHRDPSAYPPMRRKIGGTTYIVNARCSPAAREGLLEKLQRLMCNDPDLTKI